MENEMIFEVRQDELVEKISHDCVESGLPAGALVLIMEKILVNLRQEAHRAIMNWKRQQEEDPGSSKPHSDPRRKRRENVEPSQIRE